MDKNKFKILYIAKYKKNKLKKISHAATKDPACRNEDRRSHVLQLRPLKTNK